MGNGYDEQKKLFKPEKPFSPQEETNIHVYPASIQAAYYGPRMPMPMPAYYYNSAPAVQSMMGAPPYATIYPGGVYYAHPRLVMDATPLAIQVPAKGSGNSEQGLIKKLKGFDDLAMSIASGTAEKVRQSPSADNDGLTDGSDGNTTTTDQSKRKRSREGTPTTGEDGKTESKFVLSGEDVSSGNKLKATSLPVKSRVSIVSHGTITDSELRNPPVRSPTTSVGVPPETWLQNERELKSERRKQSNRESARRSRLKKQAETEELAHRVESLTSENGTLKSEINLLIRKSEKLRFENATLVESLKKMQSEERMEFFSKSEGNRAEAFSTENLLSRVNNSTSDNINIEDDEMYETKTKSGAKLHQLLDTSPRADVVAAG